MTAVAFSADDTLATASVDLTFHLWRTDPNLTTEEICETAT